MTETKKHKVLIVGGGFSGVKAALLLTHDDRFEVTLLSERPTFRYYPTLYRTATGGLKEQSSIPLDEILPENVRLVLGTASKIDRENKAIVENHSGHKLHYDTLLLALGTVTNYFGIQGIDHFSYGIKSLEEVQRFKAHLHEQLEDEHKPDLHYVIIGAGPSGIELAGSLPGYLRRIMDNHGIHHKAIHIDLVEALPRLLPRSPKLTARAVRKQLRKLCITLHLNAKVEGETADTLTFNGQLLQSHTVVWTAGVANNPFFKANNFSFNDRGKVNVDEHLQAEQNVFVLGDNAATQYSGLAQTALYDGKFVAENLIREADGESVKPYKPKQPVSIIPAGPNWAAVDWGKFHFYGRVGWWLREAADWVGFHDLEPWWKASEQWLTELGHEEQCSVCAHAAANS